MSKTMSFDEWNSLVTKELVSQESTDVAAHVRRARGGRSGMTRLMLWDDYLKYCKERDIAPEQGPF